MTQESLFNRPDPDPGPVRMLGDQYWIYAVPPVLKLGRPMEFEWDPDKSDACFSVRGFDFA